ncbi:MAG: DNA phosphorothioation-associated putative methyltransferase [Arthrospira sp. PLM2.Bin9]|nr:DNA phosphorothioation-associated putative methyltransferase [Arthrospira sp. PLM2.Bin9]TVU54310.1 MAG: DNA phosphorothioation-associated putative methyltransferase [Arthrospira sp. PLM2.Bin9]
MKSDDVIQCSNDSWDFAINHRLTRGLNVHPTADDLILYLALKAVEFQLPPQINRFSDLSAQWHEEIDRTFGSYQQACVAVNQLLLALHQLSAIAHCCHQSPIGKKLPAALYVHISALNRLDPLLRLYEHLARQALNPPPPTTLIKFHTDKPIISYLFYPDFDTDAHPDLATSYQVLVPRGRVNFSNYTNSNNPPILHRKETFVAADYPLYESFNQLTKMEEKLGLLSKKTRLYSSIGTRQGWLNHLARFGVAIQDHQVVYLSDQELETVRITPRIERHKAAIIRKSLSRPVRLALEAGLFRENSSFFDYGCGYGGDLKQISDRGYLSAGWDPYYSPETPQVVSEIVNLGYVINVIECQVERREALIRAWELTQRVLIVAAQILIDDCDRGIIAYGDGVITNRNTFQKYYQQEELKIYIDQVLNVDSIPIDLGVYVVFRDESEAEDFRASRFRSRVSSPRICAQVKRFEEYQELLQPLIEFLCDRGRLPVGAELQQTSEIEAEFGTIKRAFKVIMQATNSPEWEQVADRRRQDLLVYLALSHFGKRRKLSDLSEQVKNDIKGLFGSYKKACALADVMLYSMGNPDIIAECCYNSDIGQKRQNSLWVHISALEKLDPLLRVYEGCAHRTIGRLEGTTLIKFHIKTPKITYLFYPDFDTNPHPVLQTKMAIDLRDLQVSYRSYQGANAPILYAKEAFVTPDYPSYQKFAKLTSQEQDWGLLDDKSAIQTLGGWLKCLEEHCAEIRGHRVYWRSDADPYQVKLIKSARRNRRQKSQSVTDHTGTENGDTTPSEE